MKRHTTLEDTDAYKCVTRDGHHKPNSQRYPDTCGCREQTKGGYAYRDLVYERVGSDKENKWDRIRFYHQSDIVKKNADVIDVNTHGYGTSSTTRQRINKELPRGFQLVQRDYHVYLRVPTGDLLDVPRHFRIDYKALGPDRIELKDQSGRKIADLLTPERVEELPTCKECGHLFQLHQQASVTRKSSTDGESTFYSTVCPQCDTKNPDTVQKLIKASS